MRELLLARPALVRFVVRVRPQVQLHVAFVVEDFAALEALLGLGERRHLLLPLLLENLDLRRVLCLHLLFVRPQQLVEVGLSLHRLLFAFHLPQQLLRRFLAVQDDVHVQQVAGFDVRFDVCREHQRLIAEILFFIFISEELLDSRLNVSFIHIRFVLVGKTISHEILKF